MKFVLIALDARCLHFNRSRRFETGATNPLHGLQPSVDFSNRLSHSFNTVPLGRTQFMYKTVKSDAAIDKAEQDEKINGFRCAGGDKKCQAEMAERAKKARTPDYTHSQDFELLGK